MQRTRYIEPGTETVADRLNAIRDLALVAANADAEADAVMDGELSGEHPVIGGEIYALHDEEAARDRAIRAQDALTLEVEDAHRARVLDKIGATSLPRARHG